MELKDLRGKFVLLDFWTYCCINCMHILPELKKLEQAYPERTGGHRRAFGQVRQRRRTPTTSAEAIMRYEIEHPVINDARARDLGQVRRATVGRRSVLIDPEGNVVCGRNSGEIEVRRSSTP